MINGDILGFVNKKSVRYESLHFARFGIQLTLMCVSVTILNIIATATPINITVV
jgi:hypothetical protein